MPCTAIRMPLSKSPSLRALLVEPHQVGEVGGADRAADRPASASRRRMSVAHGALFGRRAVGRQVKIARRLGVSETPVTFIGPAIARSWMCGADGDAEAGADAHVDQRVVDRRHQVVDRPDEARHERRRDALRAGLDVDRRRVDASAPSRRRRSCLACTSSTATRSPLTEISSSSLLPAMAMPVLPNSSPLIGAHQHRLEDVVAVGREVVHDGDAAARAERRALDVAHLRSRSASTR